ncbi:MAG: potassium channel family protein [Undibacterium sp.]|nr:potassium channel family protein [Undibacterium sp.]
MKSKKIGLDGAMLKKYAVTQYFIDWLSRPVLLIGLMLSIPAFYLLLGGESDSARLSGHTLYGFVAVLLILDTVWQWQLHKHGKRRSGKMILDTIIIIGCVASAFPSAVHWGGFEWILRLALSAIIFLRIAMIVLLHIRPSHLVQVIALALLMLTTAGAGFYWLEPNVQNYSDGVWLAFTTIATVGYGDIVPSTAASKVFAVFIVLLGYAMFSIVTANIAALFVGEDEAKLERELHGDIRALHQEVTALRELLLNQAPQAVSGANKLAPKNGDH